MNQRRLPLPSISARAGLLLAVLAFGGRLDAAESSPVPDAYPVDRYEPIWKRSPFTLSSAVDDSGAASQQLALTGLLRINNEAYASVLDKQTKQRFLVSKEPDPQGLSLVSFQNPDDPSTLVVTLQRGSETFSLRYDLDYLKQVSPAPAASAASPAGPAQASSPSPAYPLAPPPAVRPSIQRVLIIPARQPSTTQP